MRPLPKPLTLTYFATEQKVFTGEAQWATIARWNREGLVSVKPVDSAGHIQFAMVTLRSATP